MYVLPIKSTRFIFDMNIDKYIICSTISFDTPNVFVIAYSTFVHNPTAQDKTSGTRETRYIATSTNVAYGQVGMTDKGFVEEDTAVYASADCL